MLIPSDILLARQVYLKTHDVWKGTVHDEMEEAPNALAGRDVASIEILFDLIVASPELHCDAIVAFVHILVNVLDSFD